MIDKHDKSKRNGNTSWLTRQTGSMVGGGNALPPPPRRTARLIPVGDSATRGWEFLQPWSGSKIILLRGWYFILVWFEPKIKHKNERNRLPIYCTKKNWTKRAATWPRPAKSVLPSTKSFLLSTRVSLVGLWVVASILKKICSSELLVALIHFDVPSLVACF